MTRSQGKWSEANVPHKGWSCVNVEDLGSPSETCEMCEITEIRYVHWMTHPNYEETLHVGCVCAEHMEEDYVTPRRREQQLRNAAQRKKRWLSRHWSSSVKGNSYLNTDGFNITIFEKSSGSFGGKLTNRRTGESILSRRTYSSEDQAKLAAFDAMIFLKNKRGWGK